MSSFFRGRLSATTFALTPSFALRDYWDVASLSQKDVNQDQTSSGVQVQGHVVEQVLGGVAHEL